MGEKKRKIQRLLKTQTMVHTSKYVLISLALYARYLSKQKEIAEGHKLLPINPKGVMLIET